MWFFKKRNNSGTLIFRRYSKKEIETFDDVKDKLDLHSHDLKNLFDEIKILKHLVNKEYFLIRNEYQTYFKDVKEYYDPKESREHARKLGYEYVEPINDMVELWVKKGDLCQKTKE